ncbi:MAG: alternative ribosome rescue aminoacyl-tRNA hydrolase ArfB [Bdellovibrionales bacterium]
MNVEDLRREVHFQAVRSRGPGGQNVNKVSSAAQLYWSYGDSMLFSDAQKARIGRKLERQINSEGQLYLRCDEFRDLERNKSRCLEKLMDLIRSALHVPKRRKPTKPTLSSRIKRKESKQRRSEVKRQRQKPKLT